MGIPAEVIDMKDYDPDDQLADEVRRGRRRRFLVYESADRCQKPPQQHVQTYGPQLEDVTSLKLEPKLLPAYRAAPYCITLEFGII